MIRDMTLIDRDGERERGGEICKVNDNCFVFVPIASVSCRFGNLSRRNWAACKIDTFPRTCARAEAEAEGVLETGKMFSFHHASETGRKLKLGKSHMIHAGSLTNICSFTAVAMSCGVFMKAWGG